MNKNTGKFIIPPGGVNPFAKPTPPALQAEEARARLREKSFEAIATAKAVGKNKKEILQMLVKSGYKIRDARLIYQEAP